MQRQQAVLLLARELQREVDLVQAAHGFILPAAASARQTCAKLHAGCCGRRALPYFRVMSANTSPVSGLGLTASQAARHLGVSISTVRRWSDAGHLQGYRTPGGQRRFSVAQLDAFLDSLRPRGG